MEVTNKRVLVFGSGISGIGAAGLLEDQGAQVVLYDGNEKLKEEEVRGKLREGSRVQIVIGSFPEELLCSLDIAVLSPGVPTDLPVVEQMRERGILITGEVELAYEAGRGDVLAITGTNGKTTTTALLGEIMENYCRKVFVVGNIGNPYTTAASQMDDDTVTVAEMSSFQLETIIDFKPKVSAILNFTPDHLNRHHTMEAYVNAKKNIARNQTEEDYCILNYEDELTREFGENIRAQVLYFSSRRKLEQGICLEDGNIIYRRDKEVLICNVEELKLLGTHNYENVMAAAAMALVYGVPPQIVRESVKAFQGVEHRIEFVTEKNGVTYYNDSKGTNPDAAIKGIQAMKRPTVLIGGGYDKDSVYTEWINSFEGKVRKLVLTGATKEKIAADARACGFEDYVFTDTFEEAVLEAARTAREGEAVLLSPACASWDMFPSYEVRGEKFKEIVNSL
ncbi:MAG: UDP-N-acetylmuramoyl-L-alanine--D-glutamate ligase [Dorea sp.]|jgi:UDP-N-acetylmuramoylalanine--D-glutamate ligase|nr:UDP-N-acetylmuramoyl-L-alanine--D-glutamate ligase [Dorea sp.]